jgi:hypothetical protein
MFRESVALLASISLSSPALAVSGPVKPLAADQFVVQALPLGDASVRYERGAATVSLLGQRGMVQVRPLRFDRGRISIGVAVYNDGEAPANFDGRMVNARLNGAIATILSYDDLVRQAENRSNWAQVGIAVAGGLAATAAASQRDTYTATTWTPYGTYRSVYTYSRPTAAADAAVVLAGTAVGMSAVQDRLNRTIESLGDEIVQRTTIDPGDSYAGRIVLDRLRLKAGSELRVIVRWYGEDYPFLFRVVKPGTPEPDFPVTPQREEQQSRKVEEVGPGPMGPASISTNAPK